MNEPTKSSRRPAYVAVASVVIIIVIVAVTYALVGTNKPKTTATASTASVKVVTKADVKNSLNQLQASYNQEQIDTAAAQAVVTASKNQVKVGN